MDKGKEVASGKWLVARRVNTIPFALVTGVLAVLIVYIAASLAFSDPVDFTSGSALGTKGVQEREVSMGDLATDAVRRAGNAQIAFMAASELKEVDADVPAGTVSSKRVIERLSYPDDSVVVLNLTGAQIRAALEKSVSAQPNRNLGFLQVSGLSFRFNPAGKNGQRIISVSVESETIAADRTYQVAMAKSLGSGALGYWRIWDEKKVVREINSTVSDAVESYLTATKSVNYSGTDRITKG